MASTLRRNFRGNPEEREFGVLYRGKASWPQLGACRKKGQGTSESSRGHGKSAKGLTIERLMEAILSFSRSANICVPLLCDESPGKVLHLCERQGSFWVNLLKGVFRKHDLQSRSTGGQRHQVPLQH